VTARAQVLADAEDCGWRGTPTAVRGEAHHYRREDLGDLTVLLPHVFITHGVITPISKRVS
jgi:hypothetical protein